jgi:hypothetical protein
LCAGARRSQLHQQQQQQQQHQQQHHHQHQQPLRSSVLRDAKDVLQLHISVGTGAGCCTNEVIQLYMHGNDLPPGTTLVL